MVTDETVNYLSLALRLVNLNVPDKEVCMIAEVMQKFRERGANFDVGDAVRIKHQVQERYNPSVKINKNKGKKYRPSMYT